MRHKVDLVEVAYNVKRLYTVCPPLEVKQEYISMMYRRQALSNNNDSIIDVLYIVRVRVHIGGARPLVFPLFSVCSLEVVIHVRETRTSDSEEAIRIVCVSQNRTLNSTCILHVRVTRTRHLYG